MGRPLANGSGDLWDAGERPLAWLGGLEPGTHEGRLVWRAKLNIERVTLDTGET